MSDEQKKRIFVALVTFFLAVASIFGYDYAVVQPREAAVVANTIGLEVSRTAGVPSFKALEVQSLFRSRGVTTFSGAVTAESTLAVTGAQANASTLAVTGAATFNSKVIGAPSGVVTLADNFTLVPTRTVQLVQSAGAIGGVVGTSGAAAGQLLCAVNAGSNTIVITDTGTTMLAGNLTLGQYDSACLVFDGTNWIQISTANN